MDKIKTLYNFRNFCFSCFNHIDIPLLSDFEYGLLLFQTKDGQTFYIAQLLENPTFDLITSHLTQQSAFANRKVDSQKVLVLLADRPDGKEYTTEYPICSICKKRKEYYNHNTRTTERQVGFVTWNSFENLSQDNKIRKLEEAIYSLIK